MHFAIQGLKREKPKELSRDMRDRIIERHKGGQGYRKMVCFSDWLEITFQYYRKFEYLKSFIIQIFDLKFEKSVIYPIFCIGYYD